MRRLFFVRFVCLFIFICFKSHAQESKNLIIFAEPNLFVALTEVARLYSQEFDIVTSVNFASPNDLVNDIDMGDPADVFITAHQDTINTLKLKGLVDVYNIGSIAQDAINLVTPINNPLIPVDILAENNIAIEKALELLNNREATLILDNYGSSSGNYAGNYLRSLNLDKFRVFTKLAEDRSPIVSSILSDDRHFALLLSSQIKNRDELKVLATKKHNVNYKLLVIAGNNMDNARQFLAFIKMPKIKQIFAVSGLLPL